jgi:hypothetical protein
MHTSVLFLSSLLASSLALPTTNGPVPRQSGPGPWLVIDYNPGCGTSPAGCAYSFSISYTPSHGSTEPGFSTTCSGTNIQNEFRPCADASISSNEVNGFENSTLIVQHVYRQGQAVHTVTGNATITDFETDGQSFEIVPSTITAVG